MTDRTTASEAVENEVNDLLQKKDFGSPLRLAREAAGLSLSEVAENLLISVDIIKALENSQADSLPPLAFTQGYIRSYARLLNVSADEIISDYLKIVPDTKQLLTPNSVLPVQKCCNDKVIKLISLSFIVTAIIVLVYWLATTDFTMNKHISDDVAAFNSPDTVAKNISETDSDISYLQQEVSTEQQSAITTEDVSAEKVTPKPEESIEAKQDVVSNTKETESLIVEDSLFLSAFGDSWCEIQDSTGKRLYYQLLNTGEEVELSGVAPFIVFLGNAPKIRVEVNNKIVDFENLINKSSNIASLKISNNASVIPFSNH